MAAALVTVISSAQATPESEDAKALANAIDSFTNRLSSASDALGEYSDLANNLPLTDLAPGDPDALDLSNLVKDKLGTLAGSYGTVDQLRAAIEAKDDDSGELKIQFGNGDNLSGPVLKPDQDDVTATADSITIPIHAERRVDQPLQFKFGDVDMAGGSLGIDFELDTSLTFHVDSAAITSAATAPPTALSLDPPTIDLCANATGSVGKFTARFGFTDVNVSTNNPAGSPADPALHTCAEAAFQDPDSVGGITMDEWTSHALSELIAHADIVKGNPSGDDLDVTFYADASLVNGDAFATHTAADASVRFQDNDLSSDPGVTPTVSVSPGLQAWLNITAGDVANGLAQFVASLSAAQGKGDAPLPLVGKSLTELFDGVKPLLDYTDKLISATVGCGTNPGDSTHFPTGVTDNLTTDTLVYCRAQTQQAVDAGSVEWKVPADVSASVETNGTSDSTVAQSPTADAVFKMTAPGNFSVNATWKTGGQPKSAIPRPGSAQELFARLAEAAGLDDDLLNLGYDATTKSLTFHLKPDTPLDPTGISVDASLGDLLRNKTNLAGLKQLSAGLNADVSDVDFDVTFGVLLNQSTSDITPLRGTADSGGLGTFTDADADFTDGVNDPQLGQVVKKTTAPTGECTITTIDVTTLTCAAGPSNPMWGSGDGYDVDGGLIDRFFVKVNPSAPELSVGNISLDGNATLSGTIGFLAIEAGGDGVKNTFTSTNPKKAFEIAKADSAEPALAVDIKAPNPFTVVQSGTPTTIPDAVGVGELLSNLDADHVSAVCNMKATAGLGISAKVNNKTLASGSVAVNWPTVFEDDSCTPDFSTLVVDADDDFDVSLRDFDPFPSVSGKHTGDTANAHLLDDTKDFTKVGFTIGAPNSPTGGNNLLNLTLRNKTTGASCTILTVSANELGCTLSGGTRAGDPDPLHANMWLQGDEYLVEGNALAWLGYILDNIDKLVDQVDQLAPGVTDKELPLVGISTKDIVGKIKSIKQTTDELRGSPLAQIDCTQHLTGPNDEGFDLTQLPRGTKIYCQAITTVVPTAVKWTVLKNPSSPSNVTIGTGAESLDTVGSSPTGRVEVTVGDPTGVPVPAPLIAISDWQIKVEFTDAAGNHNTEFPTSSPPTSLQELAKTIEDKLGVDNVLKLEVLDLPKAGAGARKSGTATGGGTADNVLEDTGADFLSGDDDHRVFIGNLVINKSDKKYCTVTGVTTTTVTCAVGSNMEWNGPPTADDYEIVGDNTKDLVVRLGIGFCSGGALSEPCKDTDRAVDALEAPLNVKDDFANIVSVDADASIKLDYAARAQFDVGIPIKLGVPDVTVLDTSGASLEAAVDGEIGLSAAIGPVTVDLGTKVPGGTGVGKLGAKLGLESDDDDVPNNKTMSFTDFFSAVGSNASFEGVTQNCDGGPPDTMGHACAVMNVALLGADQGQLKISCNIVSGAPDCNAELPPGLEGLINGSELDWTLLLQVVQQILTKLQTTLDGAAQNVKLPLIGNTLDAGANVVGAFNENVITPFNDLVQQIKTTADQDADGSVDAYDASKFVQKFIFDNLGPASTAHILQDTDGAGGVTPTIDDVVVTPLCGTPAVPCANGASITTIRDFRVTFKIGQDIDGDVPFDIGLKGVPLRLTGGVHGSGSWSLLVDVGLSFQFGPYIVANGKPGFTGTEDRPVDVDTDDPPDGTPDAYSVVKFLQDDGTDFNGASNSDPADDIVEVGMWLKKTGTDQGCRVTKVEEHKLYCTDFGLDDDAGAVSWNGTDGYELIARHAPDAPATGSASELQLRSLVSMSNVPEACDEVGSLPGYLADDFTGDRCLEGQIAFLKVNVRDRDGTLDANADCDTLFTADGEEPTALCLNASLDFQKTGGSAVSLSDLVSGNFGLKPKLSGAANIDVRIRTGLNVNQSAGFPSVLGKFHLFWGFAITTGEPVSFTSLDVHLDGLNLDAGKFISEFLGPMIKQVKDVTNPLMPVVELLQGEVPIISDLSKLVGQGPVTVLDVLEAISDNDLSLMRSILQMIKFVNALPSDGNLLIPLGAGVGGGSFAITNDRATGSPPLPDDPDQGITGVGGPTPDGGKNLLDKLGDNSSPYASAKTQPAECDRGATFGVCGLTFPFFGDAGQIFGVLMGKDATLIHYDAGSFGAGAGFGFCFPPILIGPVPVQICIGGSFRVDGRFAMGYDTSGLRKVLAGGTGTHLLDGIYFDDYDANGADVPEVKFTGTVYAEGAVSVYIFKVGIRGEIIFTMGLNLHEDPPQDGKLRIEEVIAHIFNPICLFDIEGKIEAALTAFVKIDLFITSVEFSIQIVKITLLEFDLSVCNIKPVLAHNETAGDVEKIVLNMGSSTLRTQRGIASGEINEKFTVRQMESAGGKTRFSVSAFGIQQDYFLPTAKVGTDKALLIANADDGDDAVSLLPGSAEGEQSNPNEQKPPIPFTLWANISAGTGNDEITTGDGNDIVDGDPGVDSLSTAGGVDEIRGGTGNDKIDAGPGNDTNVHGNANNDVVNGGPGADKLFGDADDDVINAGPGDNGTSVDELTGGPGNDTLNADGGGDKLWGDEGGLSFDCTADSGNDGSTISSVGNGRDSLIGAAGNDKMHGGNNDDTLDGADNDDTMCGGGGNDEMKGGAGADPMSGNGGDDNMVGSTDGGAGDVMYGNGGRDFMIGDDGTLTRDGSNNVTPNVAGGTAGGTDTMHGGPGRDFMWGQGAVDTMNGNAGNDEMHGGPADDLMHGNENDDEMYGDDGVDTMHGDANNDYMRGGIGGDHMDGDAGNDEMYGDNDVDDMRGGANDDLMRGGGGDDSIEGNGNDSSALPLDDSANPLGNANFDLHLEKNIGTGAWAKVGGADGDVIYGDAGQDDIIGGSSSTAADDGDTILGNTEQDVIVGDNGTIARPVAPLEPDQTVKRTVTLLDPDGTVAGNSGGDWIQGSLGNDDIYAGGGGDLVHGNEGDDYTEGNGGSDGAGLLGGPPVAAIGLYGDTGQDDIAGGTSKASSSDVGQGIADGADDIWGGQGHDVIAGDNADITRTGGGTCDGYVCNTFRNPDVQNVVIRRVRIWDVAETAFTPVATASGNDTVDGEDGHDRIYGQGGGDNLKGGLNDDLVFGNAGADTIFGGAGQDDLVGGTGRTDSATPGSATDGRLDAGDLIQGEADFDAISGDNSRMVRKTTGVDDDHGLWVANTFNSAVDRLIALMDVAVVGSPAGAGTSGNDQLLGGAADDVVYGQGGNDGISGGDDQDLLEGNANGSGNAPDPAGTYDGAWPVFEGDVIHGDAGADDIAGGTGWIYRMVLGVETGDPIVSSVRVGGDGRLDGRDTIFGDGGGDALAGDNTVIERALTGAGAWVLDDLYAPDALGVVRRVMRQRDVTTTTNLAPLTNDTSGGDVIYGNDGVDVAYGQAGDDQIQGNAQDDHLEGNAGDDAIQGNEGQDDVIGGTGRTFSNDETTAANNRIDEGDAADANDTLHGGNGAGAVATGDDDVVVGDNATVDRVRGALGTNDATAFNRLPFNGTWGEATWDKPNILRVIRLLDVAVTGTTSPETNGTNGDDAINGEANEDVLFGQGGNDTINGDDADLSTASAADPNPGEDYIEGNGGTDTIRGDLNQDDIAGGGSAANGILDANRDGRFDDDRNGETLRDAGDLIAGDSGEPAVGESDVVAGDNARIQRKLDGSGNWRDDAQRGTRLRDVFLFDIEIVGGVDADNGESGVDSIYGNGGRDLLFGQDNGTDVDAYGNETVVGDGDGAGANCQNATGGPGSGMLAGTEEEPNGDNDNDDLPDLNDPQCRDDQPGDKVFGHHADDYIEGNQGSDTLEGGEAEDDVIGGSSANTGHVNAILPPGDRDAGFAPTALTEPNKPNNLNDGHDVIQGNAEDDTVLGDNAFVDRYLTPITGDWITVIGAGHAAGGELEVPNPEPAKAAYEESNLVRRDVTTMATPELAGAFGNDYVRGGTGQDDVYGTLGNDWLEGNANEDAIVGDMGKIVDNVLGVDDPIDPPDPAQQFIVPNQPFLGATINQTGVLKREVTLYAFNQSLNTAGIGHDVALGGEGNDWIHTGSGEDLANGNAGDDRIFLGDNFTATTANKDASQNRLAHARVDAGWGGLGYDHVWGGYGADYSDVRPRKAAEVPGLFPTSDPETWFQVAGAGPTAGFPPPAQQELSHNGVDYAHGNDNFGDKDYHYGGWDQDTLQANVGDNGPHIGDRLLDWSGSYNGYYLCPSTYGDWVSTRAIAPGLIGFLQQMSQGDGATETATAGKSGFRETAIVFSNEAKDNTKPIHADTPAHFTCGPGTTTP